MNASDWRKMLAVPKVYLVGRQVIDQRELQLFLDANNVADWGTEDEFPAAETLVEIAGRVCYMSFASPRPGGNAKYIDHILESGHGSVTEHAVFNMIFEGVSRTFSHELVRHRAGWSYSQLSQRYVGGDHVRFVVPPALHDEVETAIASWEGSGPPASERAAGHEWLVGINDALALYERLQEHLYDKITNERFNRTMPGSAREYREWLASLLRDDRTGYRKAAREAARSVLPGCTETKLFITANVRALRHFVEMRAHPAADAEMRRLALMVLDVLRLESPALFGDYVDIVGGGVVTPHKKV